MPKYPRTAGAFLASLNATERAMIGAAQDRIRAQRQLGQAPNETIELPLHLCEEAVSLHRQGKVTLGNMAKVLDRALRDPSETASLQTVAESLGLINMHERGDADEVLLRLVHQHETWRAMHRDDPAKAVKEVTRALMVEGRGLCNPVDIRATVAAFFQCRP